MPTSISGTLFAERLASKPLTHVRAISNVVHVFSENVQQQTESKIVSRKPVTMLSNHERYDDRTYYHVKLTRLFL